MYSDGSPVPTSLCGSSYVLGGYGAKSTRVWRKTYTFPEPATNFKLNFEAIFIDAWESKTLFVEINGEVMIATSHTYSLESHEDICGFTLFNDRRSYFSIDIDLPCGVNELNLNIYTNLKSDDGIESLAI